MVHVLHMLFPVAAMNCVASHLSIKSIVIYIVHHISIVTTALLSKHKSWTKK